MAPARLATGPRRKRADRMSAVPGPARNRQRSSIRSSPGTADTLSALATPPSRKRKKKSRREAGSSETSIHRPATPAIGRREVDAPRLAHRCAADVALDELIAHQCEHPIAQEDRPRIAVPIDAARLARIVAHVGVVR